MDIYFNSVESLNGCEYMTLFILYLLFTNSSILSQKTYFLLYNNINLLEVW